MIEWLEAEDVAAVIDIRNMWQGDETKQFKDTDLVYSYNGKVYFVDEKGKATELIYKGYDKSRDSSRYGFHPRYKDKRIFRIPLDTDRRIFTRMARNSKKWKRLYAMRSGIERINGRKDRDYKFEKHTIRGLEKNGDIFDSNISGKPDAGKSKNRKRNKRGTGKALRIKGPKPSKKVSGFWGGECAQILRK